MIGGRSRRAFIGAIRPKRRPTAAPSAPAFYVDSVAGSDANDGTSEGAPWQTLAPVHAHTFEPGDTVYFKRGSTWTGGLVIDNSGTSGSPITFTNYGEGALPIFRKPSIDWANAIEINAHWIVVDGLMAKDAHYFGVRMSDTYNNNIVQNCEITNVGIGIGMWGQDCLATNNLIYDTVMVTNTAGGDDDFGAAGVWLYDSNNEVSYNTFLRCRATSLDYGYDGGAVEIYGAVSNCYIHHNWAEDCNGFMEVGGGSATDVTVSYNVVRNCWYFSAIHLSGTFGSNVSNFKIENNTIVDNVLPAAFTWAWLWFSAAPTSTQVLFRNNILYLGKVYIVSNYDGFTHTHNMYHITQTSDTEINYTLSTGEVLDNPELVNVATPDFHLGAASPAANAGTSLGYTTDYEGNTVPFGAAPDMGAYERQS